MAAIDYMIFIITFGSIYAIFSLGLNLEWGFTGLINIGHVAFFAIGAYTSAILSMSGVPFPAAFFAGIGMAGFFALLIGIPTLRLREDYLAIVTLGFAEIIRLILLNEAWLTRGAMGIPGIPQPLRGLFMERYDLFYLVLVLVVMIVVFFLLERLVKSPWGRVLKAIREDEDVAKAMGKNVFKYKIQSLIIGSAIAGAAGSLFAHFITFVSPGQFLPMQTFYAWIMVVLGGSGNNKGSILGAFMVIGFLESTRFVKDYLPFSVSSEKMAAIRLIVIGLLLIALMMRRPQGLLGEKKFAMEE